MAFEKRRMQMNMNGLLIIVLIVSLLFIIHGWRKGFLRILFSLVAVIVLMVLVSYATPHISTFLKEHTQIYTVMEQHCEEKIQSRMESGLEKSTSDSSVAGISLPQKVAAYLTESGETALAQSGVYEELGTRAANLILSGIAFFAALILALIIVKLIDKALGIVNHIPVLKGINRLLGLFAGAAEAYLLLSLFFLFVALIAGTQTGEALTALVDDSRLLSGLYYHNVLQNLFL